MSRLLAATPVAGVDPAPALRRMEADGDDAPARLVPGARVFFDVIEPLLEGGVRARLVNGLGEHRLPFDAKPGTRLQVLVSGTEARPTLVLLDTQAPPADASLSAAARVLAALVAANGEPARPPVVRAAAPLLPAPTSDVPTLARALAHALSRSGLFYEAHQAQWVAGNREREALLEEPQARLTLREVSSESSGVSRAPGVLDGLVREETVPIVQQQLAALETGAVAWRGEIWRGQMVEWTVQREGARSGGDEEEGHGQWYTRLRLTLPQLGTVDALLALDARGLDVRVAARDGAAAEALRQASSALTTAFGAAGLNVRRLEVHHDR